MSPPRRRRLGAVTVTFHGGPCHGQVVDIDHRDVLPTIKAAMIADEAVVYSARPRSNAMAIAASTWTTYHLWPRRRADAPLIYNTSPPSPPPLVPAGANR